MLVSVFEKHQDKFFIIVFSEELAGNLDMAPEEAPWPMANDIIYTTYSVTVYLDSLEGVIQPYCIYFRFNAAMDPLWVELCYSCTPLFILVSKLVTSLYG